MSGPPRPVVLEGFPKGARLVEFAGGGVQVRVFEAQGRARRIVLFWTPGTGAADETAGKNGPRALLRACADLIAGRGAKADLGRAATEALDEARYQLRPATHPDSEVTVERVAGNHRATATAWKNQSFSIEFR